MMAVIGIFILRKRNTEPDSFKVPLYPLPPLILTACTCWMIYYVAVEDIKIILYALASLVPGYLLYLYASHKNVKNVK
jgi:uncharacterized membrane protein YjjB (DUF3815 family)